MPTLSIRTAGHAASLAYHLCRAQARRPLDLWSARITPAARAALAGRTILVTGGTGAIGQAVASQLLDAGASVLLHGRTMERANAVVDRLQPHRRDGARVAAYAADLTDRDDVDRLIASVLAQEARLDGLVNNAGLGYLRDRSVDGNGVERAWSTNVVAPWQLATGLAPLLARNRDARIVNVVSDLTGDALDLDSEHGPSSGGHDTGRYNPVANYARSKQGLLVVTAALADRLREQGIAVIAIDPGPVKSAMAAGFPWPSLGARPASIAGAFATLLGDPKHAADSGGLFRLGRRRAMPAQARDEALQARVSARVAREASPRGVV